MNFKEIKLQTLKKYLKAVAKKTAGFIVVENKNSDAFTADLEKLTKSRLTHLKSFSLNDFNLMAKQRPNEFFNDIYVQLDQIYDVAQSEKACWKPSRKVALAALF